MIKSILLILGLCLSTSIFARDYTIDRVTDNDIWDEYPRLNEAGDVLWASWVNSEDTAWTVFLYDSETKTTDPISDANVFYDSHQFNNYGDAVWMGTDSNGYTQIHLYTAATKTADPLTKGDLHKTNPQISDTGDVAWMEVRGTTASNSGLMRYDSKTGETAELIFPGAGRQGLMSMNVAGDIAWAATITAAGVAGSQDILLYSASTGEITNLSANPNAFATNLRLLDNGDVLWHSTDNSIPIVNIFRHYKAADGTTTDVAITGAPLFGPAGHTAWVTTSKDGTSTKYTISVYDPNNGKINVISKNTYTVFGVYAPRLDDISARGDVNWHQIVQTTQYYQLYDAPSGLIFDIGVFTSPGLYILDYDLSDNGDVISSQWDGSNWQVYADPAAGGFTVQLTYDNVDSGETLDNKSGSILWKRWDEFEDDFGIYYEPELFVATKNPLSFNIYDSKVEVEGTKISVKFNLFAEADPDFFENIVVKVDGATLLSTTFGKFEPKKEGKFKLKLDGVKAKIDFNKGTMKVSSDLFDPTDLGDVAHIEVRIGGATVSDHAPVKQE